MGRSYGVVLIATTQKNRDPWVAPTGVGRLRDFGLLVGICPEAGRVRSRHRVPMGRSLDKGHSALRRGRVSDAGGVYLVTTVVRHRESVFADASAALAVCALHDAPRTFLDATALGWVLMPDHWHGVIALGPRYPLSSVIKHFKTRVCRELRLTQDFYGPLWQAAFHDRRLRDGPAVAAAIRYVLDNPVRIGLCAHASSFPYASPRLPS